VGLLIPWILKLTIAAEADARLEHSWLWREAIPRPTVQVGEVDYTWLLAIKQAEAAGKYDKKRSPAHLEEFREWVRQVPGVTLDPTGNAREQLIAIHDAVSAAPTREMCLETIAMLKSFCVEEEEEEEGEPDSVKEKPLE
jgi:hypothetical protein